jgi:hypothetical protein
MKEQLQHALEKRAGTILETEKDGERARELLLFKREI